jgi:hypothetical protein
MSKPNVSEKKLVGRVPGVRLPSSAKLVAANRVRAVTHGRTAKVVTVVEVVEARRRALAKIDPEAPAIAKAYQDALEGGGMEGVDALNVGDMTENRIIRKRLVNRVLEDGPIVEEHVIGKNSEGEPEVIATRLRAHPGLADVHAFNAELGITAADMQVSRKSRGEGEKDAAIAAMLRRDAMLRSTPKDDMPPPAPLEIGDGS